MPDSTAPSSGRERATPNNKDGQENAEPKKRKEIKVEADNSRKKKSKEEQDKEKRHKDFVDKLKEKEKKLKEAKLEGKKLPLKYSEVAESIQAIDAVQDEKGVIVNPADIAEYHKILRYGGFTGKEIGQMNLGEVVVAVQLVLRNTQILDPDRYDLGYGADEADGNSEEYHQRFRSAKNVLAKVQSYGEETLTADKAGEYVELDPHGRRARRLGVGTTIDYDEDDVAPPTLDELKELINANPSENDSKLLASYLKRINRIQEHRDVYGNEAFGNVASIADELDKAIGQNTMENEDDESVKGTRRYINGILTDLRQRAITQSEKHYDFDKNFGPRFAATKKMLEDVFDPSVDDDEKVLLIADLKELLLEVKGQADLVEHLPGTFDVDNPETWIRDTRGGEEVPIDYRLVFELTRAFRKGVGQHGREKFREIFTEGGVLDRNTWDILERTITDDADVSYIQRLDSYYRNIFANLPELRVTAIAGDIMKNAQLAHTSITAGWRDFDERMGQIYQIVYKEPPSSERAGADREWELRQWRGLRAIAGVESNVHFAEYLIPPDDWHDIPEQMNRLFARIEASEVNAAELQPTFQAIRQMLDRIETDKEGGREMQELLNQELEAFQFKHTLFLTAHLKYMDPEQLQHVFVEMKGLYEHTWPKMLSRVEKDIKGRSFYVERDSAGGPEHGPKKINLFDVGKRLYSERLRGDRIRMNMAEEMTKYAIENEFDESTINKMKASVGYRNLPKEWQDVADGGRGLWRRELEATREWIYEEFKRLSVSTDSDEMKLNGRGGIWAEGNMRSSITKRATRNWYERKTMHGAFGVMSDEDVAATAEEFLPLFAKTPEDLADPDKRGELLKHLMKRIGDDPNWLRVRRMEMRQIIKRELEMMGLKYDSNVHYGDHGVPVNLRNAELDELMESGYLGSLESNVFEMTWIFEWSTLNMIHIYGKDADSKIDDYKALVMNRSTDHYDATMVDHNGEFLSEDFENRGRAVGYDVNKIFIGHFAGKHNWLFGHVSVGTRFIRNFITKEGNEAVDERVKVLLEKHPFYRTDQDYPDDYDDFIRGVAVRELFIEGAISFADTPYSKVVADRSTFNKFNPIDNMADRALLKKFMGSGEMQAFLANPTADKWLDMTQKWKVFPSTRNAREFPWMEFGVRGLEDILMNHNFRLFKEPDVTNMEFENFADKLVREGYWLLGSAERFKRQELGIKVGPGWMNDFLGRSFFRRIKTFVWDDPKKEKQAKKQGLLIWLFWMTLGMPLRLAMASIVNIGKTSLEEAKKQ